MGRTVSDGEALCPVLLGESGFVAGKVEFFLL